MKVKISYEVHNINASGKIDFSTCYSISGYKDYNCKSYGMHEAMQHIKQLVETNRDTKYPIKEEDLCVVQVNTEYNLVHSITKHKPTLNELIGYDINK